MIPETQRQALHALREALRLCEANQVKIAGLGAIPDAHFAVSAAGVNDLLNLYPERETYLGDAAQEQLSGSRLGWRFHIVGFGTLRWEGIASRAWWNDEAPLLVNQMLNKNGRRFRLDFATGNVYEVGK